MRSTLRMLGLATVLLTMGAFGATELKIITNGGHVAFTAGDDWQVLQMQTEMPVATIVFQLPNPADVGSSDSTNLVIQLFEKGSAAEKSIFASPAQQYGAVPPILDSLQGWTIIRQNASRGTTTYSVWDAKKSGVADVSVSIRLAWPQLATNSPNYAAEMESLFRQFLLSVSGEVGAYEPQDGEITRRHVDGA